MVAGYLVGAWLRPAPAALACLVGAGVLTAAHQVASPGQLQRGRRRLLLRGPPGGTALAGALVTARAAQVRELRRLSELRTEQHAAQVRAAGIEERNRVDAEVTRTLMQRLGELVVQASAAALETEPSGSRQAVARIESSGRATLDDLRAAIGSLRAEPPEEEEEDAVEPAPPVPFPLSRLDVLVGCCGVPLAVESVAGAAAQGPAVANVAMALAVGAPLAFRRRHPLTSVATTFVLATVMTALLTPLTLTVTSLVPLSLAAYALGAHTTGLRRLAGVPLLVAGVALTALASPSATREPGGLLPTALWVGIAWLAGVVSAQQAARAERLRGLLARVEAGRGAELRLTVAEQRQAIARDLHDSVAHAMTVVTLHAGAAQQCWEDPETVRGSLATIEATVRDAMAELRSGLATMEDEGPTAHDLVADVVALCRDPGPGRRRRARRGPGAAAGGRGRPRPTGAAREPGERVPARARGTGARAHRGRPGPARGRRGQPDRGPEQLPRRLGHRAHRPGRAGRGARRAPRARGRRGWSGVPGRGVPAHQDGGSRMIRVLLADDQELVRSGLRLILSHETDLEVVGEAADGHAAVAETRRTRRTWC